MPEETKLQKFSRLYPKRVEALMNQLRLVSNLSSSGYEWKQDLVHDTWVQIGIHFCQVAKSFGVKFELIVDGDEVQWAKPKSKRRKAK